MSRVGGDVVEGGGTGHKVGLGFVCISKPWLENPPHGLKVRCEDKEPRRTPQGVPTTAQ